MKKLFIALILILILLTACSGDGEDNPPENTNTQVDNSENIVSIPNENESEMSLMDQLLIGTFMLEETDHAVDQEQAADLLLLWQVLNNLVNSDTAAKQEIEAVVNQISKKMTEEQLQIISEMNVSNQSMMEIMQELGLNMRQSNNTDGSEESISPDQNMQEGFQPGNGMRGGENFHAAEGMVGLSQEEIEAMQATRQAGGAGGRMGTNSIMGTMLIEPLIKLLEGKAP